MPRPYNQKTVKDALLLLDIYASNGCSFEEAASGAEVRPSSTGYRVAEHLVYKLADMFPEERLAVIGGEAAGLLREGWRIGDEIPMRGASATLENVDAILREQYGAGNVEAMANAPSPFDLSSIERTVGKPLAVAAVCDEQIAKMLASSLDAVEDPTDEMIEEFDSQTEFDGDKHEQPDTLTGDVLDPWEPTE